MVSNEVALKGGRSEGARGRRAVVVVVAYCWKSETRNWEKFWKSGHHHPQDDQGVTFEFVLALIGFDVT